MCSFLLTWIFSNSSLFKGQHIFLLVAVIHSASLTSQSLASSDLPSSTFLASSSKMPTPSLGSPHWLLTSPGGGNFSVGMVLSTHFWTPFCIDSNPSHFRAHPQSHLMAKRFSVDIQLFSSPDVYWAPTMFQALDMGIPMANQEPVLTRLTGTQTSAQAL